MSVSRTGSPAPPAPRITVLIGIYNGGCELEAQLIDKWQLATAEGISHIMLMPYLTKQHVDRFVADVAKTQPPPR